MTKKGIRPSLFSAFRCIFFWALLILLLLPMPAFPDELMVSNEKQIEDEDKKPDLEEKPTRRIFPEMPNMEDLEISIKPKVSDTIQNERIRPPIDFKYEIAPNWELFLRLNTFLNNPMRGENRNGMSDISIGTKYHWNKWLKPYVDTITAFSVQIPTMNNDENTNDEYHTHHFRPQIIFSKMLSDWYKVQLFTDINMDILSASPDSIETTDETLIYNSLNLTVGFLFPTRLFKYSVETEWITTEIDGGNQNSVYLKTGLFWDLKKKKYPWIHGNLDLGLGVRYGVHDTEDDFAFFAKVNWDLPLKMRVKKKTNATESIQD